MLSMLVALSCTKKSKDSSDDASGTAPIANSNGSSVLAAKLTADNCTDPEVSDVTAGVTFMRCDGTIAEGTKVDSAPASPDPWDVRYGVTVGSTTGKLKMNCRNMVDTGTWGALDTLSTIDDYNNGGAFPSENPWPGTDKDKYFCGYNDPAEPTWELASAAGASSVFVDKITELNWTRGTVTTPKDWDEASGGGWKWCFGILQQLESWRDHCWRLAPSNTERANDRLRPWNLRS